MQFADLMRIFREARNEENKRGAVHQGAMDAAGIRAVGRDLFEPRSVRVALTERPTDDEMRSMHNWMRGWKL